MNSVDKKIKKWLTKTIATVFIFALVLGTMNIIVDPYFHFHKPITKYRLGDERYINDGIARHFEYDAIITGNSLTQNFKPSQFNKIFGTRNCIKLPYSGAGYKELWESLERSILYQNTASIVLIGCDLEDLSKGSNWHRYDFSPDYLYDSDLFNDLNYIFNKDVLYRGTLFNLLLHLQNKNSTSFDEYSSWERETGPEYACASLTKMNDEDRWQRELSEVDLDKITQNVSNNIIPVLRSNADTRFIIVIPPSSIAKWAEYWQKGEVTWRTDGLRVGLKLILSEDNAEVYAFDDAFEITTDLDRYSDTIHYDDSTNEWMLNEIANGKHRITNDNLEEYLSQIASYYNNYNYETLNAYIL